jgi:hypothetical protein
MKQILCVLAISLVIFSCQKAAPTLTLPDSTISYSTAWDSFQLQYGTFYHLVIKRGWSVDSSVCIRFKVNDTFMEYKTNTDTNGLHLSDSVAYVRHASYNEVQKPDQNYYVSSVGYVLSKFYPLGGSTNTFHFHDLFVTDTFIFRIGLPIQYNVTGGSFRRANTDTATYVTIYK